MLRKFTTTVCLALFTLVILSVPVGAAAIPQRIDLDYPQLNQGFQSATPLQTWGKPIGLPPLKPTLKVTSPTAGNYSASIPIRWQFTGSENRTISIMAAASPLFAPTFIVRNHPIGLKGVGSYTWTPGEKYKGKKVILSVGVEDNSKIISQSATITIGSAQSSGQSSEKKTGSYTQLLTHPSSDNGRPSYAMNYFFGMSGSSPQNAKITRVTNTSQTAFRLWFTDKAGRLSSNIDLAPGASTTGFNNMINWGGIWEAASPFPLPKLLQLKVEWSE